MNPKLVMTTALLLFVTVDATRVLAQDQKARELSEKCAELPFNSFPPNQLLRRENPDGSAVSVLHAEKAGVWGEFFIQVDQPGTYRVDVGLLKGPDKGICQLQVNGDPVGEPVDCYASAGESLATVSFGEVTFLKATNNSFRFRVSGKNPASSGSDLALARITLTPVHGFTLLSPNGSCQTTGDVLLRWNPLPQAGKYQVEVDGSVVKSVDASAASFQTTGLAAGPHHWRVIAARADGKLQPSNMFSFVVGPPPPYPFSEFSEDFSSLNPDTWLLKGMTISKGGDSSGSRSSRARFGHAQNNPSRQNRRRAFGAHQTRRRGFCDGSRIPSR